MEIRSVWIAVVLTALSVGYSIAGTQGDTPSDQQPAGTRIEIDRSAGTRSGLGVGPARRVLLIETLAPGARAPRLQESTNERIGGLDCDDDYSWAAPWILKGYVGCTSENQNRLDCLPNVSSVEPKLRALDENRVAMTKDKYSWKGATSRPGSSPPHDSKRHLQSIQYVGSYDGHRYIVTSLSDEHRNQAAVQLVKTFGFGSESQDDDKVIYQRLLVQDAPTAGFNHPGGAQLLGQFLFAALEDFTEPRSAPATGVWYVSAGFPIIQFVYTVPTTPVCEVPDDDEHQSTAAVTRLRDGSYLLATCVYEGCDYINFYRSRQNGPVGSDPDFKLADQWSRHGPGGLSTTGRNWSHCAPQNMNFVVQDDGTIYLVMFGAVERLPAACVTGYGYDDHIFVYKLHMDPNYEIWLEFITGVDVIKNDHKCGGALPLLSRELHGLNFLAGSGVWARPDGRNTISFLATEHYDTCGARQLHGNGEGVKAKTRWSVSANWATEWPLTIDYPHVTVDEGDTAINSGSYLAGNDIDVLTSVGWVNQGVSAWNWRWDTADGPDDSQTVSITRRDNDSGTSHSESFELVVENVPPRADAGPDQVVECNGGGAMVRLDASGSRDPGNDPLSYTWTWNGGASHSSGLSPLIDLPLGAHLITLVVNDGDVDSEVDSVLIEVVDTTPPAGSITAPADGVCTNKPVTVEDDYSDQCDPNLIRAYDPGPGPTYTEHGDFIVTLTATDSSGNSTSDTVGFTIDTRAPEVKILAPAPGQTVFQPQTPFPILFEATDNDGAAGGVVHEVVKLAGCPIYDGWTYGNRNGLLSDETLTGTPAELCRLSEMCGFDRLQDPELRIEAIDCAGNLSSASHISRGSVMLRPELCGGGGKLPGVAPRASPGR